jgi:hypothetical protein
MSGDKDKIYADASQPATLIDVDMSIDCPTLGDAVVALDNPPEPRKSVATIKVRIGSSPLPRLIGCITARPDPLERAAHIVTIDCAPCSIGIARLTGAVEDLYASLKREAAK